MPDDSFEVGQHLIYHRRWGSYVPTLSTELLQRLMAYLVALMVVIDVELKKRAKAG